MQRFQRQNSQGFTLAEVLVVISIVGILVAIATPNWLSWRNSLRLNAAQDQTLQVLREAQSKALSSRQEFQVSFREVGRTVQWATHLKTRTPAATEWQPLPTGVQIDVAETTVSQSTGIYRVEFTHRGHINPPLGRITFSAPGSRAKRCVVLSTFLGAMRKASENATADEGGRFCY